MSQGCINCTNQPSDNGSLGGAGHEGTVTPMVIGLIIGTVAIFILVVCALFYCVKLENHKHMAKNGDSGGGGEPDSGGDDDDDGESVKSSRRRPSSVTVVPVSVRVVDGETVGVRELPRSEAVGASLGEAGGRGEGKRNLFGWGRKSALPVDNSPVMAIEMV